MLMEIPNQPALAGVMFGLGQQRQLLAYQRLSSRMMARYVPGHAAEATVDDDRRAEHDPRPGRRRRERLGRLGYRQHRRGDPGQLAVLVTAGEGNLVLSWRDMPDMPFHFPRTAARREQRHGRAGQRGAADRGHRPGARADGGGVNDAALDDGGRGERER